MEDQKLKEVLSERIKINKTKCKNLESTFRDVKNWISTMENEKSKETFSDMDHLKLLCRNVESALKDLKDWVETTEKIIEGKLKPHRFKSRLVKDNIFGT